MSSPDQEPLAAFSWNETEAPGSDSTQAPPSAPAQPAPGPLGARRQIGAYLIQGEIARGGMGIVFRVRHPALERDLALKLLLGGRGSSANQRERFLREARIAAGLRHPNLVAVYDAGEDRGVPYMAAELIKGETLSELMSRQGTLMPRRAARIALKLARVLAYAHSEGVLHRDVKPDNVILDGEGEPRLTDFGVAKLLDGPGGLTASGQMIGTPAYMPPEQTGGGQPDGRADVYSLGATLFELVKGRPPFEAQNLVQLMHAIAAERPAPLDVDSDLDAIAARCLEKDPEDRYADASALADDLQAWLEDRPIQARPAGAFERLAKWGRRNRGGAIVGALVLGLVSLGSLAGVLYLTRKQAHQRLAAAEASERDRLQRCAQAEAGLSAALAAQRSAPPTEAFGSALEVLQQARAWLELAPQDPQARSAVREAALQVAKDAQESGRHELAGAALDLAGRAGADVQAQRGALRAAVHAGQAARQAALDEVLQAAEQGKLSFRAEGFRDALFELQALRGPGLVEELAKRLSALTDVLRATEAKVYGAVLVPSDAERRLGAGPLTRLPEVLERRQGGERLTVAEQGLLQRAERRLEARETARREAGAGGLRAQLIVAAAQTRALGSKVDLARLCVQALGRIPRPLESAAESAAGAESRAAALEALQRYLLTESDPERIDGAIHALIDLGGAAAADALEQAGLRFGLGSPAHQRLERVMKQRRFSVRGAAPLAEALDPAEALRRRAARRLFRRDYAGVVEDASEGLRRLGPEGAAEARGELLLLRGKAHSHESLWEEAEADLEAAAKLLERGEAWRWLGRLRLSRRRQAAAHAALERAVQLDPQNAEGWVLLGNATRDPKVARRAYGKALGLRPRDVEALNGRAGLAIRSGRWDEAVRDLDLAIEADPYTSISWANRGLANLKAGRITQAQRDLIRAVELDPLSPRLYALQADAHFKSGAFQEAIRVATQGLRISPGEANCLVVLGNALKSERRYEQADLVYTKALKSLGDVPRAGDVLLNRGLVRLELGRGPEALADQRAAAERYAAADRPDAQAQALLTLAKTQRRLGRSREARASAAEATKLQPESPAALLARAQEHLRAGRRGDAAQDFQSALQLAPRNTNVLRLYAHFLYQSKSHRKAEELSARALELSPEDPKMWGLRGLARIALGRLEEGISDLEASLARAPEDPAVLFHYGRALLSAGRAADAVKAFDALQATDPRPVVLVERARAKVKAGRKAEAVTDLEACLNHPTATARDKRRAQTLLDALRAE